QARQQEAVKFLSERAFQVPEMFLDPEILWRIEARGAIDRIRDAQTSLIGVLLQPSRLNTLVEYEALLDGDTYTLSEYLTDLRSGLFGELQSGRVDIDVYRRNLQRAYLEQINSQLNPPPATGAAAANRPAQWGNDVRAMYRSELRAIDQLAWRAQSRAANAM